MSPICGAHQPRRFGSRLMGFLLGVTSYYVKIIIVMPAHYPISLAKLSQQAIAPLTVLQP